MILNNKDSIYMNIYNEFKKYIIANVYKYDDKLPFVRSIALEYGINPNTVQRAFQLLEDEGYIKTISKKGVYVNYRNQDEVGKHSEIKKEFEHLKKMGISKEEVYKIIEEVYNDRN